jgi:hypothetical protein
MHSIAEDNIVAAHSSDRVIKHVVHWRQLLLGEDLVLLVLLLLLLHSNEVFNVGGLAQVCRSHVGVGWRVGFYFLAVVCHVD